VFEGVAREKLKSQLGPVVPWSCCVPFMEVEK
jgi:hypothetical protein